MKIDAHQHFWQFDPIRDTWITQEMKLIRRDFMPADLLPVLTANQVDGCVTVQSDQDEMENKFQLKNANENKFIKGVVGWVDLQADDVEDRLAYYKEFPKMKGFRHVLQGEGDRALMLRPKFMKGISKLEPFGFTYDILVFHDQLQYLPELLTAFPGQKFVLDHIAKPDIKNKNIDMWKKDMLRLSRFENLYCKVSGMTTEAHWKRWQPDDFTPYLDVVVETFGTKRIMFGSDWPVCLLAGSYESMLGIVKQYFSCFSLPEQEDFYGGNATEFYQL